MLLHEMTWPAVAALDRDTPVVFPIAAVEQHGHHLPLHTDSLLLGEVIRRVQQKAVSAKVLFAPLQWFGNSHHHLDMPGTLSASPRGYLDMLRDLAECVLIHGFRRVVFVNGHGGNTVPSHQAVFELRQKYRDRHPLHLLALTYWESTTPHERMTNLVQNEMGHACEWETSMMLTLRPDLVVGDVTRLATVPFGRGAAPGYRGWTMPDRSEPGHIGDPAAATREKGEGLFREFAGGVESFLTRVVEATDARWDL